MPINGYCIQIVTSFFFEKKNRKITKTKTKTDAKLKKMGYITISLKRHGLFNSKHSLSNVRVVFEQVQALESLVSGFSVLPSFQGNR